MNHKESEDIMLDEPRFLRQVRWRSTLRTILLALVVVTTVLLVIVIGTELLLQRQEERISMFYDKLIRYTEPNTIAIAGNSNNLA